MLRGFGLYRADRFRIDKQSVVRLAGLEGKLVHGDAALAVQVDGRFVLRLPPALL